eukprot:1294036-Pleurochrysis_carterae.AAC.4
MMKQTVGSQAEMLPGRLVVPCIIESHVEALHHFFARWCPSSFLRRSIGRRKPGKKILKRALHQLSACLKIRCLNTSFAKFKESTCMQKFGHQFMHVQGVYMHAEVWAPVHACRIREEGPQTLAARCGAQQSRGAGYYSGARHSLYRMWLASVALNMRRHAQEQWGMALYGGRGSDRAPSSCHGRPHPGEQNAKVFEGGWWCLVAQPWKLMQLRAAETTPHWAMTAPTMSLSTLLVGR